MIPAHDWPDWFRQQVGEAAPRPLGWDFSVVGPDLTDGFGDWTVVISAPGHAPTEYYVTGRNLTTAACTLRGRIIEEARRVGLPNPYDTLDVEDDEGPICVHCGGRITDYGPKLEDWDPTVCNECCECPTFRGQPLSGPYDPDAFRCYRCGSWDADRHGDKTPPGFDPDLLPCGECNATTPHRPVAALCVHTRAGLELPDATIWRCRQCEFASHVTHPELDWRVPLDKPIVPHRGGNEIGLPVLHRVLDEEWPKAERVLCDGEHEMPWCDHLECWHGPKPRRGDLVNFDGQRGAEYQNPGVGIVESVGPKTVKVGIFGPTVWRQSHRGLLHRREFPDIEHERICVRVPREEL